MGVFLRKEALPGLKNYKYSSVDNSLLSKYILGPFWRWFVTLFPLWLAPNMVTLTGFFFVIVNLITLLYVNPTFDQVCSPWVYVSYAVGLFLYQTFDACDGGQARRTGQSGPLGELFDHCVDAINTTFGVLVFCAAANTGYGWPVFAAQFATLCNFYLSTWEEYHTGTLFLSFFSGPVEGIIIVCCLYLVTAFFGPGFWNEPVLELLGISEVPAFLESYREQSVLNIYLAVSSVLLAFNILTAAGNVIASRRQKKLPVSPALTGVIPFVLFYISLLIWASSSTYILHTYLLLPFTFTVGFSVALSVGRIITAHVTSQKFPITNPLMVYPTLAVIIQAVGVKAWGWDPLTTVSALVWLGFGLTMAVYGFFVAELIVEITTYLDIYCLRIKHLKVQ